MSLNVLFLPPGESRDELELYIYSLEELELDILATVLGRSGNELCGTIVPRDIDDLLNMIYAQKQQATRMLNTLKKS